LEEELCGSPQDYNDNAFSESEEHKHGDPQKRQKTAEIFPLNTTLSAQKDSIFISPTFDAHPLDA
jgi:hypothetical protein